MTKRFPILVLTVSAFALSACAVPEERQNTAAIAAAGAAVGGIIGGATGGRNTALVGAAVGAGLGTIIGNRLDEQAAALRETVDNDDVQIVNTGSELIVTMPQGILFDVSSSALQPDVRDELAAVAQNLIAYPDTTVKVVGHTDSSGRAAYNLELSERRANSVANVLRQNGVPATRLVTIGAGEDQPVASNLDEEGRAQNRRVEIIITPIV